MSFFWQGGNFFPRPTASLYQTFRHVQASSELTKQHIMEIPETARKMLSQQFTFFAIDGSWPHKNPQLVTFLSLLMEGNAILVESSRFQKIAEGTPLNRKLDEYVKKVVGREGLFEATRVAKGALRFGGKLANKFGEVGATLGFLGQPVLAVYETVESLKDVVCQLNQKNWIVINDDNYAKVIATLACMNSYSKKDFGDVMNATLMGPEYFWKRWHLKNKGVRQNLFWESKKQLQDMRKKELGEVFLHDWMETKQTGRSTGWVAEMRQELLKIYDPNQPSFSLLTEDNRELLSKETRNFSKEAEFAYALGYHAFVENDENMQKKLFAYWKYILSERVGAYNPQLVISRVNAAHEKQEYRVAYKEYSERTAQIVAGMAMSAGITALFLVWDLPFSPLITMPLRLATYGLPKLLA